MKTIYLMMLIFFTVSNNSYATIGCAEWTIVTPGGSIVTHTDSWKEKHGTCLKEKKGNKVYISKIIWWQYYEGNVTGYDHVRNDKLIKREDISK